MTKTNSKKLSQIILGGMMILSVTAIGCNDSSKTEEVKTDTTTEKMQSDPAPVVMDTTPKMDTTHKMDTANTRPIKTPN